MGREPQNIRNSCVSGELDPYLPRIQPDGIKDDVVSQDSLALGAKNGKRQGRSMEHRNTK